LKKDFSYINKKRLLPVHNSKFKLANHPWKEPLQKITENASKISETKIMTPKIGEIVYLNKESQLFENWWEAID
jgi:hypothetical protein